MGHFNIRRVVGEAPVRPAGLKDGRHRLVFQHREWKNWDGGSKGLMMESRPSGDPALQVSTRRCCEPIPVELGNKSFDTMTVQCMYRIAHSSPLGVMDDR